MPVTSGRTIFLRACFGLMTFLLAGCLSGPGARSKEPLPWIAYYASDLPGEAFSRFALVIFDAEDHPPLSARPRPIYLGYLSLGEVDPFRPYFEAVEREGLLAGVNDRWGSHFVDLRDPRWSARVLDELLPALLDRGFDGVLLDTLDSSLYLEEQEPIRFKGMQDAAVRLVRQIRTRYPGLRIAMNRAYALLPRIDGELDYLLAESVYGGYDFERKTYVPVTRAESQAQLKLLHATRLRRPALDILTLDYWNPADTAGIARVYRKQKANGFHPYVSTILLDRIGKMPADPNQPGKPALSRRSEALPTRAH